LKSLPRFQFTAEHEQVRLLFQASLVPGGPRHLRSRGSGSGSASASGGAGAEVSAPFSLQFDPVDTEYKFEFDPSAPPMTLTAKDAPYTVASVSDDGQESDTDGIIDRKPSKKESVKKTADPAIRQFFVAPGFVSVLPGDSASATILVCRITARCFAGLPRSVLVDTQDPLPKQFINGGRLPSLTVRLLDPQRFLTSTSFAAKEVWFFARLTLLELHSPSLLLRRITFACP
jgi:hypothetical protein